MSAGISAEFNFKFYLLDVLLSLWPISNHLADCHLYGPVIVLDYWYFFLLYLNRTSTLNLDIHVVELKKYPLNHELYVATTFTNKEIKGVLTRGQNTLLLP